MLLFVETPSVCQTPTAFCGSTWTRSVLRSLLTLRAWKPHSWRQRRNRFRYLAWAKPMGKPAWREKPSWFLIAEKDRMVSPHTQRFTAARMKSKVVSLPVHHTPLASGPDAAHSRIADNRHGACRRLGSVPWSFCRLGEHSHGCGFARRYGHCPLAVRI